MAEDCMAAVGVVGDVVGLKLHRLIVGLPLRQRSLAAAGMVVLGGDFDRSAEVVVGTELRRAVGTTLVELNQYTRRVGCYATSTRNYFPAENCQRLMFARIRVFRTEEP